MDSVIRGNSIVREAHFDLDGVLTNATLPRVTIRDSLGVAVIVDATPTNITTGIYQYTYAAGLSDPLGIWQDEWQGIVAGQALGPTPGYFEMLPVGSIAPVPSSTYTYNLATDIGKVRWLIQDHDMSSVSLALPMEQRSAAFTDEELQFCLDSQPDLMYAAAMALRAWANNKQLIVVARRNSKADVDYGSIRRDLMAAADAYELNADRAPADATAEQSWTVFAERRIIWNEYLRETGL